MPYVSVTYPKTDRPYTFYTSTEDSKAGEQVLVQDKNGFSLCTVIGYVPKPAFKCNVVIMDLKEMKTLAEDEEAARLDSLEEE